MPKPKTGTPAAKPASIRPRERYASGRVRQVSPEVRTSPTLVRRILDHAVGLGADARVGSVLGQMALTGVLSSAEAAAGFLYAETVGKYERIKGHPRRTAKSASYDSGFGDTGLDIDALRRMDPAEADKLEARIKRKNRQIEKAYEAMQVCLPNNARARAIIEDVCCNDVRVNSAHHDHLKIILGNLAKHFQIPTEGAPAGRKPMKSDARIMAEAACDAMFAWFASEKAIVESTETSTKGKIVVLTARGTRSSGSFIAHTVEMKAHPGMLVEALLAQIVKAAERRTGKADAA